MQGLIHDLPKLKTTLTSMLEEPSITEEGLLPELLLDPLPSLGALSAFRL
jgi:hypothetical protein